MVASRCEGERGQASVELVAVIPALAILVVLAAQVAAIGWALWSAEGAARAGSRAAAAGGDATRAARSALPEPLRSTAQVSSAGGVRVTLRAPALAPGLPQVGVEAGARLPGDDGAP
jgi:hypothetical protein